ncbi:(2Fe-2S) ferredoxin domain-containing protein [Aeromicrobium choanae]|uniref:(2Fe-2S) ferredoxin n=1 Tax=Aeromicrobium choanae TaxID=1736691 RepID=A0A1T4Z8T7_9ACTN|nr:(2Fe-2S) ferredoxin domain-containing protein [Aeromicrobium choanae]SKB10394.1 (2Fe-2S) ferredoxin [Aeromicrobium choanae]
MTLLVHVATALSDAARQTVLRRAAAEAGARIAFLQGADPTLVRVLDELHAEGVRDLLLEPVTTDDPTFARSWVGRVAGHWHREQVDPPTIRFGDRVISGREARLSSPAWETPPPHRHHLLLCRGPRCSARGSDETYRALVLALVEQRLTDADVLMAQTGCLFPCNHGPVAVVHPEGAWYGPVRPEDAGRLVREHLALGRPVDDLRIVSPTTSTEGAS